MSVHDEQQYPWLVEEKRFIERVLRQGKMVIGICLGAQLIAHVLGARVYRHTGKEIGWWPVHRIEEPASLLTTLPAKATVFHWHGDTFDLPQGAVHIAESTACRHQAFLYKDHVLGLQFHLEIEEKGIERLIEYSPDDLTSGSFVQSAEEMRLNAYRLPSVHRIMFRILDELAARHSGG